jgi:hypothetical protein
MAEAWRGAGFRVIGGSRPYWTQKQFMARSYGIICSLVFGFIGYCLGEDRGLAAELVLGLPLGIFGAAFGYGGGLFMVYSGRAVAARKLKRLQQK